MTRVDKKPAILAINGGSSSIKFALFSSTEPPGRLFHGEIERIGLPDAKLSAKFQDGTSSEERAIDADDFQRAVENLIGYLKEKVAGATLAGIGHRIVHGGAKLIEHQLITPAVLDELRRIQPLDLAHLPSEISLIETFVRAFPGVPQVACFDTAFHRDLPTVASMLPIPRRYFAEGVRRFGFHGLSYTYLMQQLAAMGDPAAASGRVILAHLGSGASMAAVRAGKPIDTTMAFTPTAGLVMGTRPGDLDPGLLVYLMRAENLSPEQMDEFVSHRCGLLGVSQTTSDMQDLIRRRKADPRATEAVDLFCYQAKKFIGALTASMDGLDTLVFSGGIGEHGSEVRAAICEGLSHLGVKIDASRNAAGADVISSEESRVIVRVIKTDEEVVIAGITRRVVINASVHGRK